MKKTIMVSGGFDPIHIGLMRKKGYVFMSWEERAEIIRSIRGVVRVEHVDDSDNSVCEAIQRCRPDAFANGGDRKGNNTPEVALCDKLGIDLVWNVGGGKIQSSSKLVTASKR